MTLIELMIALTIVSIIAALAYPSYVEHIRSMRRSDAQQSLVRLDQEMQRYYSRYRRFDSDACDLVSQGPTVDEQSIDGHYGISSIDSAGSETLTADAYRLHALPTGGQAGDTQCAEFRLTNASVKTAVDSNGNDTTDLCWR